MLKFKTMQPEVFKNVIKRASNQLEFGDWDSLSALCEENIQNQPDRGYLALLAAIGLIQTGSFSKAKKFLTISKEWGVDDYTIYRLLISGVYNSLGKFSAIRGDEFSAVKFFKAAVKSGIPGCDVGLVLKARLPEQLNQLSLPLGEFMRKVTGYDADSHAENKKSEHGSLNFVREYWRSSIQEPAEYANADSTRSCRLVEIVNQFVPQGPILEIGTNAGRNLHHLFKAGFTDLVGIEINPSAVEAMRSFYPELMKIPVFANPVEDVIGSFLEDSFECVFTMAVLEHIHYDSDWVFAHIARIAKRIITIEDELRSGERHFRRNYEKVFVEYGMRQIHMEDRSKLKLPTGFVLRVFEKRG